MKVIMEGRKRLYIACVLFSTLSIEGWGAAVRPVVTFSPNWSEILILDPVTITCDVGSAALENQRYHWYKDGNPMDTDQQSIKIDSVLLDSDKGAYQCGTSASDLSPPVTLNVSAGLLILQRPPVIHEGAPLTLRCHSAYGYDGTNTTFYKDDKEIKFSVNDSEIHIEAADGGSSGMYRCTKLLPSRDDDQYHYHSAETYISVGDSLHATERIQTTVTINTAVTGRPSKIMIIVIGATVGSVILVLIFFLILLWKYRNKNTSLSTCQEQQAASTMAADPPPALEEDICYSDIRRDHSLPASSTPASKSVDESVLYAVVKRRQP